MKIRFTVWRVERAMPVNANPLPLRCAMQLQDRLEMALKEPFTLVEA